MESTVRWHKPHCSEPSVTAEDGVPRCHSCGETSSDLVAPLVAQSQAKGGDIHLPAETPLGEANLWWPSCVPYRYPQTGMSTNSAPWIDEEEATMLSKRDTKSSSASPIYPSSLDSNHFRLIYLTGSKDVSSPIHIEIEEHAFDDHPEYEAVSYVWGGEDADPTLRKPVYVGRFWDAILVTSNCSALLYYLRRPKVCRVIWVDAICINQADNTEKPAQISRMGDIYANCQCVVAYFGEDLVSRPPGMSFRPRIDFQRSMFADGANSDEKKKNTDFLAGCAKTARLSQDQLVERKFLSRIWIVQELLLPQKVLIPLGDSDIVCSRDQSIHIVLRANGKEIDRSTISRSLRDLLRMTSRCHASDPRDRVYGLLGLFQPEDTSRKLVADYSLSWRDCWLGTAAYLLLIERNLTLLAHAVGNDHPIILPSWVPNIQDAGSWLDSIPTLLEPPHHLERDNQVKTTASDGWMSEIVMFSVKRKEIQADARDTSEWRGQKSHRLVHPRGLATLSLESASVDPSNGALRIQALRVFNGPCRLTAEAGNDGFASIWVQGPSTAAYFLVAGLGRPLNLDKSYQLFVISCDDKYADLDIDAYPGSYRIRGMRPAQPVLSSQPVLLALTTPYSESENSNITLHFCCRVYDIRFYSMDSLGGGLEWIDGKTNALHSLHRVLSILNQEYTCLRDPVEASKHDWVFFLMFPSFDANLKARHVFPLLIRLCELESLLRVPPDLSDLISATAKTICPDFDPFIRDNDFHLTVKDMDSRRKWTQFISDRMRLQVLSSFLNNSLELEYSYPSAQGQENWTRAEGLRYLREFPVNVRFPLSFLVSRMRETKFYKAMYYARQFSIHLNKDLETLLSRSPQPEDRCVFLESWGRSLVEELGIVWKFERITIV